jgi:hypothetical protein
MNTYTALFDHNIVRMIQPSLTRRGDGWGRLSYPALKRRAKVISPLRGGFLRSQGRVNSPHRDRLVYPVQPITA